MGEKQHLIVLSELRKQFQGRFRASVIKMDENVIRNERQGFRRDAVPFEAREPKREKQLVTGPFAKRRDRFRLAVGSPTLYDRYAPVVDVYLDARIFPFGHPAKKNRCALDQRILQFGADRRHRLTDQVTCDREFEISLQCILHLGRGALPQRGRLVHLALVHKLFERFTPISPSQDRLLDVVVDLI